VSRLRAVAIAFDVDLAAATDLATFRRTLAACVDRHLAGADAGGPTLVAFPEHLGLLGLLVGPRARSARDALARGATLAEGLLELALAHGEALAACARRFPGVTSPGQLLHLALTDTLVRAVVGSARTVAAERGVWLSVATALPDWASRPAAGPDAALATAGADDGRVHVATDPLVRNRNVLVDPDGRIVARQDKAYLVASERDPADGFGLSAVGLEAVGVAATPFGRVASVISKDAWMPDVNDRLDQLGAQLLLQPEAFDRWAEVDRAIDDDGTELADLWPPDKFRRGGWWMVQRHRAFRANVTPVLLGRLGELRVRRPGADRRPGAGGAPGPRPARPGPLARLGRGRDVDRPARGRGCSPGAAAAAAAIAAAADAVADVTLPDPPAGGPLPARPAGYPPSVAVAPGGLQVVPEVATVDGAVVLAWVDAGGALGQGVVVARGDGLRWSPPVAVAPAPRRPTDAFDRQWRPRLAVVDDQLACLHLAFPHESWDLVAAVSADDGATWHGRGRVDDADDRPGVLRERGHDAPALCTLPADSVARARLVPEGEGDGLLAVWSDLRWPATLPAIRWTVASDRVSGWRPSRRADGGDGPTRGQTEPSVLVVGDRVLLAWQELAPATEGGRPAIWLTALGDPPSHPRRLDVAADRAAYRPRLGGVGELVWLLWEEETVTGGGGLVVRVSRDAGRSWSPPRPVDATRPAGVSQRRAVVTPLGPERALVVFEDDRAGAARVLAVELGPQGPVGPPWRVCDTPRGAAGRAPVVGHAGGALVAVWQDTRGAREQLRSCRLPVPAADRAGRLEPPAG
jgi:predicted amidohydrolase